jgi:hypothetical protein
VISSFSIFLSKCNSYRYSEGGAGGSKKELFAEIVFCDDDEDDRVRHLWPASLLLTRAGATEIPAVRGGVYKLTPVDPSRSKVPVSNPWT